MESEVPAKEFCRFMELPDHVQIEIMSYCFSKTKFELSETCTHLNKLMWTSPKLFGRIRLNLNCVRMGSSQKVLEDFEVVLTNSKHRKYKKMKLYHYSCQLDENVKTKLMETINFLGKSVTDLAVELNMINNSDLIDFLRQFPNVEKLTLDGFMSAILIRDERILNTQNLLPRLKDLNVDFPDSSILEIVKDINTLERLTFQCYEADTGEAVFNFGVNFFEDFVIKQNRLKELKIYGMHMFCLFEENRIDEINFQLETLHAVCFFVHRNNVEYFFKRQRNIIKLDLINFFEPTIFTPFDRPTYSNILHTIFSLPKLESITIGHGETVIPADFEFLSDVQNKTVKELHYWGTNSQVVESFINIFPNIRKVQFEAKDVQLTNISCDKLEYINVDLLRKFSYSPSFDEAGREKFEEAMINFIKRHRNIRNLTIGHKDWIGTDFGLSLRFLKRILKILKSLRSIEVFNPLQLEESLKLLNEIHSHKLHF